jgi:hypothetical protein
MMNLEKIKNEKPVRNPAIPSELGYPDIEQTDPLLE